jgi:hypothetical protein
MPKTSTTAEAYVSDEQPLEAVKNFAWLIARFAETMDEKDGTALQAAAYHIVDLAEALEERRGKVPSLAASEPRRASGNNAAHLARAAKLRQIARNGKARGGGFG